MLYNKIIFFLGFYSFNFKPSNKFESYINSKYINTLPNPPLKNNKKLVDYLQNNSVSPKFNLFIPEIKQQILTYSERRKIYFYQFYSLLIFLLLSIQPIYLLVKGLNDLQHIEDYLITFLCHINTPVNYLWAKYYYRTNHFSKFCNQCSDSCKRFFNSCKKCDTLLVFLLFASMISILYNLILSDSFLNKFNCYYYSNNSYLTYFLSIFEWIYARSLYSLTTCSFTIIFCSHTYELNEFKLHIENNDFSMENNYCLTKMITSVAKLRHSIELSTNFYNKIMSFITITGTLSFSIFMSHKLHNIFEYKIEYNDIYLIQNYIIFIIFQFVFFINIYKYSSIRESLVNLIQSPSFINQFLTRWTVSKIKKKCFNNACSDEVMRQHEILSNTKILICIDEENATTIDWFVLEKLINIRWIDFSIMGISFHDGQLIKKVIALSSLILIILGYV